MLPWVTKAPRYDESKHKRDHGKFSSTQGARGTAKKPAVKSKPARSLHEQIASLAPKSFGLTLQRLQQMSPDAVYDIAQQLGLAQKPPELPARNVNATPADAAKPKIGRDRAKQYWENVKTEPKLRKELAEKWQKTAKPNEGFLDWLATNPASPLQANPSGQPPSVPPKKPTPPDLPARQPVQSPSLPHHRTQQAATVTGNAAMQAWRSGDHQAHSQAVKAFTDALVSHQKAGFSHIDRMARQRFGDSPQGKQAAQRAKVAFTQKLRAARAKLTTGQGPPPVPGDKTGASNSPTAARPKVEDVFSKMARTKDVPSQEEIDVLQEFVSQRLSEMSGAKDRKGSSRAYANYNIAASVLQQAKDRIGAQRYKSFVGAWDLSVPDVGLGWMVSKGDSGGRWITIGGTKGEGGKRSSGSPVFIKDGKIVKGHPSLTGKRIDNLKGEADKESNRSEQNRGRAYHRASWRKRARKEGHDPKHLEGLANEIKTHHDAFASERKELLQFARNHSKANDFADLTQRGKDKFVGGHEDASSIHGFDQVTEATHGKFSHHFHEETGEHGSHSDQLYAMLTHGNPEPMDWDEAYSTAFDQLGEPRKGRQKKPVREEEYIPF